MEKVTELEKEYEQLEEVTLDVFIAYMQRLSDMGYGHCFITSYPTGGTPFPYLEEGETLVI